MVKSPHPTIKGLLNKSWYVPMMEHHEVIKISGRITTNGLKMIYKVIYIGKSDHEAINPVWSRFRIRDKM